VLSGDDKYFDEPVLLNSTRAICADRAYISVSARRYAPRFRVDFKEASRLTLSPAQLATLSDLHRKKTGETVGWISIALARSLTDLGLAEREPSGWRITAAGEALLDGKPAVAENGVVVVPFPPAAPQ